MKEIKTALAALVTMAAVGVAHASNWVKTDITDDYGLVVSIDMESLRFGSDGMVQAWFKEDYSQPKYIDGTAYVSKKFIERYFCKTNLLVLGPQYAYDSTGYTVARDETYDPPKEPVPDSLAEARMKLTCQIAITKKAQARN
ncbi:hypothetical protein LMG28614_07312 [Paraburkholderia ultramafica]|uniref:Surface-adhesin protein E-like domain-containing protein n=1 Tax=Paraburkholderia ultramafica TaxID=1544867 RepID=A0A6S7BZZ8_9BURK|nr:surface-adhesin E family protein [Paraburkholderia ultramafica]CAB3810642.1 hypothetical protein LMG28614_07312 [Paraburkholderia ultramafica]